MIRSIRKIIFIVFYILFAATLLFFIFRNPLLHWGINKAKGEFNQRFGILLDIKSSSFSGINSIIFCGISITPKNGDTLVKADTLSIRISFWTLLQGTIRLNELNCNGGELTVSCKSGICNYYGFIREKQSGARMTEKNYSVLFKKLLDRTFNLAPQKANITNVSVIYRNDTLERSLLIREFHSDENSINGLLEDEFNHSSWECTGKFLQRQHAVTANIYPSEGNNKFLPLLKELTGTSVSFDTMHFALNGYRFSSNRLTVDGNFSIRNLVAFHKKISDDTVKISSAAFDFILHADKSQLEIDSNSVATLNLIRFHPFIGYETSNGKEYSLNLNTEKTNATDFFSSLPEGMFDEVREITADGSLQFSLNFKFNTSFPDSLIFGTTFSKEKFHLKNYGSLLKMNDAFSQSVYEKDIFIRSFIVGPENPAFTPLEKISPDFVNAVLTSEDGNFYFHNGFNEDAFRQSIITNIKAGKFVRGGSTISMQLVKNVFLNRKKTIARKAEEALLVWLIESNRIYTKERMLEVYMNIIELGPDVYGIGEASHFYFSKTPQELTLPEGIFLASLLPRPKFFKYSFDTLGNLKPFLADYYRVVSNFMLKKNLITQEAHDNLQPHVVLSGHAREMIIPTDTLPEEEDLLKIEN